MSDDMQPSMSEDTQPSTCYGADVGGYATGSDDSTDLSPYDTQTVNTRTLSLSMCTSEVHQHLSMSMVSDPGRSGMNSEALLSAGDKMHHSGVCKPCAFFHKQGCQNGASCIFCHRCPSHEKQRRKRLRRRMIREHFAPTTGQGPTHGHWADGRRSWHPDEAQHQQLGWQVDATRTPAMHQQHSFTPSMECSPSHGSVQEGVLPALLSTPAPPASPCRFAQEESSYAPASPSQMGYHAGSPVQYTLVPVPMQHSPQHHTSGMAVAMACPPWSTGSAMPYMCVVNSNGMVNGYSPSDQIQVPAL